MKYTRPDWVNHVWPLMFFCSNDDETSHTGNKADWDGMLTDAAFGSRASADPKRKPTGEPFGPPGCTTRTWSPPHLTVSTTGELELTLTRYGESGSAPPG